MIRRGMGRKAAKALLVPPTSWMSRSMRWVLALSV